MILDWVWIGNEGLVFTDSIVDSMKESLPFFTLARDTVVLFSIIMNSQEQQILLNRYWSQKKTIHILWNDMKELLWTFCPRNWLMYIWVKFIALWLLFIVILFHVFMCFKLMSIMVIFPYIYSPPSHCGCVKVATYMIFSLLSRKILIPLFHESFHPNII